ncbi:MAG TPA: hypothetical protein VGX92_05005 [Pyrinomonadaceae bacterium]|jgi:hypothetical protein|nr:hypothetical protein [Pyrinomonadaceae bacterium]
MEETKETAYTTGAKTVCDALRYLCDASYAVLPKDVAHQLGEFKKNLLSGMRWVIEKDIEWVDARIAGGDRLREEWRRATAASSASAATGESEATGGGI